MHFFRKKRDLNNLSDLYNRLPNNIRKIIYQGCIKHYQIRPEELEIVANEMSTFTNFRQTLFNDNISNFFKNKSKFFDDHLASRRKSNSRLDNISLYPKGKNMEFVTDKLIDRLKKDNVIFERCDFDKINIENNSSSVKVNNLKFDKVIITAGLGNIQKLFRYKMDSNYEHYVSQVFVYFTLKDCDFKYQYLHINDLNLYCSRISNCSFYSKTTEEGNHVLIAEIPLSPEDKLWDDENNLRDIAWNEIIKSRIINKNTKYKNYKILKISKTFSVPKVNFYKFLNELELNLQKKFFGNVTVLGQGIFTRHKFVKELLKNFSK